MKRFLAIDIGASSGRHIVGWLEDGKLNLKEVYRFENGPKQIGDHLYWDAERLFREVVNGLRVAKEQGVAPSYIGIDTWAVDYALLDEEDKLIDDIFCYRDKRTEVPVSRVHKLICFEDLYAKTGIQYQPFNTIYQLYSDKMSRKLCKATSFLMLPDWLNFRLTGVKKQEYTNATSTGMVNAQTHTWDEEIIAALGFNKNLFGELSQPGTIVGELTQEIQKVVGFNATVILPATHDTASAVLAAPLDGQTPYISSGTWSLLGVEQSFAHTDESSLKANYSNEGSINYGFRYQKNIMGLWMLQNARKELRNISFPELANLARASDISDRVDVNDNRFLAPKSMIKEISDAVGKKLGVASTLRVIYESLAQSYKKAIEELEANTGKTYSTLNIIGGGSRDRFLNELTANATGKKIITGPVEATAIGNLAMQMIGVGDIKDLSKARSIIKQSFDINEVE